MMASDRAPHRRPAQLAQSPTPVGHWSRAFRPVLMAYGPRPRRATYRRRSVNRETQALELQDYIRAARRRWWPLAAFALLGVLIRLLTAPKQGAAAPTNYRAVHSLLNSGDTYEASGEVGTVPFDQVAMFVRVGDVPKRAAATLGFTGSPLALASRGEGHQRGDNRPDRDRRHVDRPCRSRANRRHVRVGNHQVPRGTITAEALDFIPDATAVLVMSRLGRTSITAASRAAELIRYGGATNVAVGLSDAGVPPGSRYYYGSDGASSKVRRRWSRRRPAPQPQTPRAAARAAPNDPWAGLDSTSTTTPPDRGTQSGVDWPRQGR